MTVYFDNPAGRLHRVLRSLRRHAAQQAIHHAWASALEIPGHDVCELLRRLAFVFELPGQIEAAIDRINEEDYDRDLAMRWQTQVQSALAPALFSAETAGQLVSKFGDDSLASLEHCSYVLHKYRPERVVSDEELDRISGMITDLAKEIDAETSMDADLREFLLLHTQAMARALRDLGVRGPAALEDALDQACGAVSRRSDLSIRSDTSPTAWKKFGNLVIALAAILQITTSSLALPGQIRQELDGPAPAAPSVVEVTVLPPSGADTQTKPHGEQAAESANQTRTRP